MVSSSLSDVENVLHGMAESILRSQSDIEGADLNASKEFAEAVKFSLEWAIDVDEEGISDKGAILSPPDSSSTPTAMPPFLQTPPFPKGHHKMEASSCSHVESDHRYPMCSRVLWLLQQVCVQCRTDKGESLLERVAWDIIQPLLPYSCLSMSCCAAFASIVRSMAQECSAREMFTLFMEVLHMSDGYSFSPWPLRSCLLQGFTVLLPRISRRRVEFLEEALPVFTNLAKEAACSSTGEEQQQELATRTAEDGQSIEEYDGLQEEGGGVRKMSCLGEGELNRRMREDVLSDMVALVEMLVRDYVLPEGGSAASQMARLERLTASLTLHLIGVLSVTTASAARWTPSDLPECQPLPSALLPSSSSSKSALLPSSSSTKCPYDSSAVPGMLVRLYRSLFACGFSFDKLLSRKWVRWFVTDTDIAGVVGDEEEEEAEQDEEEGCDAQGRRGGDLEEVGQTVFGKSDDEENCRLDSDEDALSDDGRTEVEVGQGLGAAVAVYHAFTNKECGAILGVRSAQDCGSGESQPCVPVLSLEQAVRALELARLMLVCSPGTNRIPVLTRGMELVTVIGNVYTGGWGRGRGSAGTNNTLPIEARGGRSENYLKTVMPVLKALQFPLVFAPLPGLRKTAFEAVKALLGVLPPWQRFGAIKTVIDSSPHAPVRALFFIFAKEEFLRAWDHPVTLTGSRGKSVADDDVSEAQEILSGSSSRGVTTLEEYEKVSPFLSPALLQLVRNVLQGDAGRGLDVDDLPSEVDVMMGALNLFRFVLLREISSATDLTGVRSMRLLTEARQNWLLPLRHLAGMTRAKLLDKEGEGGGNWECVDRLGMSNSLALDMLLSVVHRVLEIVELEIDKKRSEGEDR